MLGLEIETVLYSSRSLNIHHFEAVGVATEKRHFCGVHFTSTCISDQKCLIEYWSGRKERVFLTKTIGWDGASAKHGFNCDRTAFTGI